VRRRQVGSGRRPAGARLEAQLTVGGHHGGWIEVRHAAGGRVTFRGRHQQPQHAAGGNQAGDGARTARIISDGGTQQRSPREVNRDEGGKAAQLCGQLCQSGGDEPGVRQAATVRRSRRTAGCLAHRGMARIDGEHQLGGMLGRPMQDVTSVTRTQVDRDTRVRGGQVGQLADVHLGEATASQESHAPTIPPLRVERSGQ
jgi:hypothetical protein